MIRLLQRQVKTTGFILRKRRLPNRDNIVTLFTADLGKINVFAKGIKKITSRRSPHMQTGNFIRAVISVKDNRNYLQETALISAFSQIKSSDLKSNYLYFIFFVLDRLLPEHQNEEKIFNDAKKFIIELAKTQEPKIGRLTGFLNTLLRSLGYIHEDQRLDELVAVIEELINEKMPVIAI